MAAIRIGLAAVAVATALGAAAAGSAAADPAGSTPGDQCPLGWPVPAQTGGLASLIALAPLAGPFSDEAFAPASAYQPLLRLVGPLLDQVAPVLARYQPAIDPVIARTQAGEAAVLQAILPFYGPYRQQVIQAEGTAAAALTPILDRASHSDVASCLIAWEAGQTGAGSIQPERNAAHAAADGTR